MKVVVSVHFLFWVLNQDFTKNQILSIDLLFFAPAPIGPYLVARGYLRVGEVKELGSLDREGLFLVPLVPRLLI